MLIEMFSRATCPYCMMAKSLLRQKGLSFKEIEISNNDELRIEMMRRSARHTVPQIFINDTPIGGYDDMAALEGTGELDEMIETAQSSMSPPPGACP